MLSQKENVVKVEGILSEIDLKYLDFQKNGQARRAINGSVKIRVDQVVGGEERVNEVPVFVFVSELKNDGTKNQVFTSWEDVMKNWVSIAAGGIDAADRVRVTSGRIEMNEYYGQNGQLVTFPRVSTSFINKVRKEDCKPKAEFSVIFAVGQKGYKVDREGVETDQYFVKGIVPRYNGQVDVVEFIAANENVASAMNNYWESGDTVKASGRLNFTSRTEVTSIPVDFGEPQETTRTVNISELIITGGSSTPLEGDMAFDVEDIEAALVERQTRLNQLKEKSQNRSDSKATQKAPSASRLSGLGF